MTLAALLHDEDLDPALPALGRHAVPRAVADNRECLDGEHRFVRHGPAVLEQLSAASG